MRWLFTLMRPSTMTVAQVDEETVVRAVDAWLAQDDLTQEELDALVDHDIFPVSCETCRYGYLGGELIFHTAPCNSCLTGLPNWEPKDA